MKLNGNNNHVLNEYIHTKMHDSKSMFNSLNTGNETITN